MARLSAEEMFKNMIGRKDAPMTASGFCAWKVVFRWFTWMAAMLDANPSIGAAVATVKKGLPSLKLKYRVISLMVPVPTATTRSQSWGI